VKCRANPLPGPGPQLGGGAGADAEPGAASRVCWSRARCDGARADDGARTSLAMARWLTGGGGDAQAQLLYAEGRRGDEGAFHGDGLCGFVADYDSS